MRGLCTEQLYEERKPTYYLNNYGAKIIIENLSTKFSIQKSLKINTLTPGAGIKLQKTQSLCLAVSEKAVSLHRFRNKACQWRDGRVVDCSGLENRRTERYRGFESLSLRKKLFKRQ